VVEMTIEKSFKNAPLSLCLIKHYAMKIYGERGGISQPFLTSALHVSERLGSRQDRFAPEELTPSTHWKGGWVDHRTRLDAMEKKIPWPCRELNPAHLARSSSLYRLSYSVADTYFHSEFLADGPLIPSKCIIIRKCLMLIAHVQVFTNYEYKLFTEGHVTVLNK
jgi:hypothetical protein